MNDKTLLQQIQMLYMNGKEQELLELFATHSDQLKASPYAFTTRIELLLEIGKKETAQNILQEYRSQKNFHFKFGNNIIGTAQKDNLILNTADLLILEKELRSKRNKAVVTKYQQVLQETNILLQQFHNKEGYEKWLAIVHKCTGLIHAAQSKPDTAIENYQLAKDYYLKVGDLRGATRTTIDIGNMYHMKGEVAEALNQYKVAYDISQKYDNDTIKSGILNNLGVVSRLLGKLDDSLNYYNQSLQYVAEENKQQQAALLNNIGIIYFYKGDMHKAIENYQEALKLRVIQGNLKQIASSHDNIGEAYVKLGKLNAALRSLKKGLNIRQELTIEEDLATSYDNIGDVYFKRGSFTTALNYYFKALDLKKQLHNDINIANSYRKIGKLYLQKGKHKDALEYFQKECQIRANIGNQIELAIARFNIFRVYIELNDVKRIQLQIQSIQQLKEHENPVIQLQIRLAQARFLMQSTRFTRKAQAYETFKVIVDETVVDSDLTIYAYLQLLDILFFELKTSGDIEVVHEINEYIRRINKIAEEQESFILEVQVLLLSAKLKLLEFAFDETKELLQKALRKAERYDLDSLQIIITREQKNLSENYDKWIQLNAQGSSLAQRIELAQLDELTDMIVNEKAIEIEIQDEKPIAFLVTNRGGLAVFSQNFDVDFDEHLVASFLSAINSFGKETFSTQRNIERVQQGEYQIIQKELGTELTVIYIYIHKETYPATTHFNVVYEQIEQNTELVTALTEFKIVLEPKFAQMISKILAEEIPNTVNEEQK